MSARVDLVGELPRDLPPGALLSHGSFLINLEGEWGGHGVTGFTFSVSLHSLTSVSLTANFLSAAKCDLESSKIRQTSEESSRGR